MAGDLAGAVRSLYDAAPILRDAAGEPPESMTVAGIVGAYYAALAVRAHAEAGARSAGAVSGRGGVDAEAEGGASDATGAAAAKALATFDSSFHPRAKARLEGLADGIARGLESGAGVGNNGGAAEYDRLREAMSAAEFVRQYDRGLRGA